MLDMISNLWPMIILGVVVLIAAAAMNTINTKIGTKPAKKLPYEMKSFLLSKAENSFYKVLCHIVGDDYSVYPKIRLADIVAVKKKTKNYMSYFGRIKSKHVDFVLCDKFSKPKIVVELDDKSHNSAKTKESDKFKNELFNKIGLKLVRVKVQSAYSVDEIKTLLYPTKVEDIQTAESVV